MTRDDEQKPGESLDEAAADDELLSRLAEVARGEAVADRQRFDDRWDALCAGELPPEEEAALRAAAATSPEGRAALAAFAPLGADFQGRLVRRLREERQAAESSVPAPSTVKASALTSRRSRDRRRWRRSAWAAAGALAAAAVLLLLLRPTPVLGPLPEYALSWEGGARSERSVDSTGEVPVVTPGVGFVLTLRPQRSVEGPVAVRFYLRQGERVEPWPAADTRAEVAASGAVRLAGVVGGADAGGGEVLAFPAGVAGGEWTLLTVVGRPRSLPAVAELAAGASADEGWLLLRQELRIDLP